MTRTRRCPSPTPMPSEPTPVAAGSDARLSRWSRLGRAARGGVPALPRRWLRERLDALRRATRNGFSGMIVSPRSAPTETAITFTPLSSATRSMYARAFRGELPATHAIQLLRPAGQGLVLGLAPLEHLQIARHLVEDLVAAPVTNPNLDLREPGQDVELRNSAPHRARSRAPRTRSASASNQPVRRGRPVVAPNSPPICRSFSPVASLSSVGYGPPPTRVEYALLMPMMRSSVVGPTPEPVAAFAATVLELVTNG